MSPHLTWRICRVINAEKSEFNEDQAACCQISVRRREPGLEEDEEWLILCSTQVLPQGRPCSPCCQPFASTQGHRFRKHGIAPSVLHAHMLKPFCGCVMGTCVPHGWQICSSVSKCHFYFHGP